MITKKIALESLEDLRNDMWGLATYEDNYSNFTSKEAWKNLHDMQEYRMRMVYQLENFIESLPE